MSESSVLTEDDGGVPRFISTLSSILQRVADRNDALASGRRHLPQTSPPRISVAFSSQEKPEISIRCYMDRIFQFANCSNSCFVVAFIYLDRFLRRHPSIAIDSLNVHRFLITSILTSVKFMEDRYYNNAYYARVGGISLVEMNYLEVDFLFGLGFQLNVSPATFASYCSMLEAQIDLANPLIPARLHCLLPDEESSSSCKQKELAV